MLPDISVDSSSSTTQEVSSLPELLRLMQPRCSPAEMDIIRHAYELAEEAHRPQKRSSGEPYIKHPLAVAGILANLKLDCPTICAALMHDVAEDTPITIGEIEQKFGAEVSMLVDAVTKLSKREGIKKEFTSSGKQTDETPVVVLNTTSSKKPVTPEPPPTSSQYKTDSEAESIRKMLLGLAKDTRVVLIKLADRLHNMRTLNALKPEKQKRIAKETLDIYAPLANRLGIWEWKQELEDLGFRYSDSQTYSYLNRVLELGAVERDAQVKRYIALITHELNAHGIMPFAITGRAKQIFSIWQKMNRKSKSVDLIRDAQAIRIIIDDDEFMAVEEAAEQAKQKKNKPSALVNTEDLDDETLSPEQVMERLNSMRLQERADKASAKADPKNRRDLHEAAMQKTRERDKRNPAISECYRVLGIVHSMWQPIAGEMDDYIAMPKDNQYRSLHTAVITKEGHPLEVQIRTSSMHKAAEFGIAAHWLYKDSGNLTADYQSQLEKFREAIKLLNDENESARAMLSAMRTDQLQSNIYVFTPQGKVIEMPLGSTVLDFAYMVHTEIGHKTRGAKVNGRMVALDYKPSTGVVIEIITKPLPSPNPEWIYDPEFLYTAGARAKVKSWLRKQGRPQNIDNGRNVVERELKRLNVASWLTVEALFKLYKDSATDLDDFFEQVGYGQITVGSINGHILEEERRHEKANTNPLLNLIRPKTAPSKGGWVVAGARNVYVVLASCCAPQPGDRVVAYLSALGGIKLHKADCDNLKGMDPDRIQHEVHYEGPTETYTVQFLITAAERTNLLHELTGVLSHEDINILGVQIDNSDTAESGLVKILLTVELPKAELITNIISRLEKVPKVYEVERITTGRVGAQRQRSR